MVEVHEAYETFIQQHIERRSGERLRRLKDGHGHAEKLFLLNVWWPAFHQFDKLHPEFEIHDFKDGYRYLDFAYVQPYFRMAVEINGFGPHWRNISKWQFADYCQRQNHLIIDGWKVIRFTFDQISEQPRLCRQTIQQLMGCWLGNAKMDEDLTVFEREIIRFAVKSFKPITPRDICFLLRIGPDFAQRLLRALTEKKWLQPASGTSRIRSYTLHSMRSGIRL
jgi:hypothetical protein